MITTNLMPRAVKLGNSLSASLTSSMCVILTSARSRKELRTAVIME